MRSLCRAASAGKPRKKAFHPHSSVVHCSYRTKPERKLPMKTYSREKRLIPTPWGQMKIIILRPAAQQAAAPGVLWIHGGGYATGMAGMVYMSRAMALVKKYGAVVVAPEYRLAGRHPYPDGLEDCCTALLYMKEHASELNIDPARLMVGGESAGGGLTAALCMACRDHGNVNIAFQMPLYPMLDDRDTPSSRNCRGISWNTRRNHAAWKLYLTRVTGAPSPYAAPARQTDYTCLPPCYTFVGNKEPFYCETLTYIENLQKAGVPASVDVYPSGFHAFDMLRPWRKISRRAAAAFEQAFQYAVQHYTAPQKDQAH